MIILGIDTTAVSCSAALVRDRQVLCEKTIHEGLTHSETLLPMIEELMEKTGLTCGDIDLFSCTAGPGSFTGVRIGVATIKGLAFARKKPCVGISTLESLAYNLRTHTGILSPVMDARRGQVYNALFRCEGGTLTRLTPDRATSLQELKNELATYGDTPIWLAGDGYAIAYPYLTNEGIPLSQPDEAEIPQSGASTALLAYDAYLRGEFVSDRELTPVYLRLPQAERDRLAKQSQPH